MPSVLFLGIGVIVGIVICFAILGEIFPSMSMFADFWKWRKRWLLQSLKNEQAFMILDINNIKD